MRPPGTRAVVSVTVALALAGLASGCGGGSDRLDAAELISRGDELCREGQERFAQLQQGEIVNAKAAVQQTDELVSVATDELNELRALRPPEDLRDPYDSYLAARASALELLEEGRDAAAERNASGYAKAQAELAAGVKERERLARAVGFEVCSQADADADARQ